MIIDSLIYKTGADLTGLGRDLKKMGDMVGRTFGADLKAIKAPKIETPKLDDAGSLLGALSPAALAASMRGAFSSLGGQLKSQVKQATQPLSDFATDFRTKFDTIGPTFLKLASRIDSAMRFPKFVKEVEDFRAGFLHRMGLIGKQASDRVQSTFHLDAITQAIRDGLNPVAIAAPIAAAEPKVRGAFVAAFLRPFDAIKAKLNAGYTDLATRAARSVYGTGASTHVPPNMASAFIGARSRNARGRFAGMQSIPTPAAPTTMAGTVAPKVSGWQILKRVVDAVGFAVTAGDKLLNRAVENDARDVNRLIGVWLNFKKATSWLSTLGPVVTRTWQGLGKIVNPKINIDPKQSAILRGIGDAAQSTGSKLAGAASSFSMAMGLFGYAYKLAGFFKAGVAGSANLAETLSKTDAVLGQASAGVKSYADDMAKQYGLVKQETLDAAAGFGAMFKSQGQMAGKGLEEQTIKFTQAAADLKSFSHISFDEASRSLQSALIGRDSDALRKLGIDYSAEAVKARAATMGLTGELTGQQEIMIRSQIITAGLGDSQGDLARTAGSTANQYSKLVGSLANFGNTIGAAMMPAIDKLISLGSVLVSSMASAFESSKFYFDMYIDAFGKVYDFIAAGITHPAAAFEVLKLKAAEVAANIVEWFAVIPENFAQYASYIGHNWYQLLGDLAYNATAAVDNIVANFGAMANAIATFLADPMKGFPEVKFTPLTDGFIHTAEKLPALIRPVLTDLSKEIAAAGKPIMDDFARRQMKIEAPQFAGGEFLNQDDAASKAKKGKKENEFGEAAVKGTRDYADAVNRAVYGLPKKATTTLENLNREQLVVMRRQLDVAERNAKAKPPEVREVNF